MINLSLLFSPEIAASLVRALMPLLLLGLGGLICYQAGVFNVALEGLLLMGAFAAVAGSALSGNVWVGVVSAVGTSTLVAFVFAFGAVARDGDPLILGTAINIIITGMTAFLLQAIFDVRGTYQDPELDRLPHWLSGVDSLPWIGPSLASLSALGILAIVLAGVTFIFLYRTIPGTRLRGAGARPEAARSLGVNPSRYQVLALGVSGILGGLAGAELSLGSVALFTENMSAGRGWIIVLILLLTGGRMGTMLVALVIFAYAQALGFRLQTVGLPMQFSDAAPYVATLGLMIWLSVRLRARRLPAESQA